MTTHTQEQRLSDRELAEGYWIVTHKERVKHIAFVTVIVANGVLFLFILAMTAIFYWFERDTFQLLRSAVMSQMQLDTSGIVGPRPLSVQPPIFLPSSDGSRDSVLLVSNTNDSWRAEADITLSTNGTRLASEKIVLYPKQRTYVFFPNISASHASRLVAEATHPSWDRMTPADTERLAAAYAFHVSDVRFKRGFDDNPNAPITRAFFSVENKSIYGFWEVRLPIILFSSGSIVAANVITLTNFKPREKRIVTSTWTAQLPNIDSSVITPLVNIFDDAAYSKVRSPLQRLQ